MSFQEKTHSETQQSILTDGLIRSTKRPIGFVSEVQSLFADTQSNLQHLQGSLDLVENETTINESEALLAKAKKILQDEVQRDKKNQNKGVILQCEKQLQSLSKRVKAAKLKLIDHRQQMNDEVDKQYIQQDEEDGSLIGSQQQQQMLVDTDSILYEETLQARRQRVENANRQMRAVHSIYKQIDSMTSGQSDQLRVIDGHIEETLFSAKETTKELIGAKTQLEKKAQTNWMLLLVVMAALAVSLIFIAYE